MARAGPQGNGPRRLFPRVLWGFYPVFCWTYAIARISGRESTFQQRVDTTSEFLEGGFTDDFVAVDEKGRRALDLQDVLGELLAGADLVYWPAGDLAAGPSSGSYPALGMVVVPARMSTECAGSRPFSRAITA